MTTDTPTILNLYRRWQDLEDYRKNVKASIVRLVGEDEWDNVVYYIKLKGRVGLYRDILRDIVQNMETGDTWTSQYLTAFNKYPVMRFCHGAYPALDNCSSAVELIRALDQRHTSLSNEINHILPAGEIMDLYMRYTEMGMQLLQLKIQKNEHAINGHDILGFY